jgi:DNA invertase Pin-like site-specific DNA recombinase|uniref:recombinase family protein n=1 Tax=Polynucleobacter sp. TaxID=2029855 RepID=UPI004048A005
MPIAYSYIRFSSEKQAKGDSIRRQKDLASEYIERNPQLGLELDTSLHLTDEGLSAYKGVAQTKGSLGVFNRLVEDGKIERGSYLLVESLDRLSRQTPRKALAQLGALIDEGIVVVTLNDNKVYTSVSMDEDSGMSLMFAIMLMSRAHEESATKADRVSRAWRQKMLRVADGVQLTKRVPFWIVKEDRTKSIADKVAIVKRIFKLSADGLGGQRIATLLNNESVEPPTNKATKWGISSVKKVLNSEAVLGVLNTADGVRHENYYPRVISEKLWIKTRFQGVTSKSTRDSNSVHPLSGLCVCAVCGATATRSGKSGRVRQDGTKNIWRTLVCANSMGARSACSYQSIGYDKIVQAVLVTLGGYQYAPPKDDVGGELWQVGEAISFLSDDIIELQDSIKVNKNSPTLRQELTAKMLEYDKYKTEEARLKMLSRPFLAREVEGGLRALLIDGLVDNKSFKQVVRKIAINFNERSLVITGHDGTMLEEMIDLNNVSALKAP